MEDKKPQWDKPWSTMDRVCLKDQLEHYKSIINDAYTPRESDDTVVVRYWVLCGNPNSGLPLKSFTFLQPAPRSVCNSIDAKSMVKAMSKGIRDLPVEMQDLLAFDKDLFKKYSKEVYHSQIWHCVKCNKPAGTLRTSTRRLLSPPSAANTKGFIPMVLAVAIPVCPSTENGGVCSNTGLVMGTNYGLVVFVKNAWKIWDQMKTCQQCGSTSNIQLCGGCKLIGYCSKECQTKSWTSHKEICKLAKKNKAIKWES